jgi:hypothetical protein
MIRRSRRPSTSNAAARAAALARRGFFGTLRDSVVRTSACGTRVALVFHEPSSSESRGSSPQDLHAEDLALANAAREGSGEARRAFAERMACVPRMLATLNARIGRPLTAHDVEDLAQDAVVAVWRGLATYRGFSSLEAWVFRCCHH